MIRGNLGSSTGNASRPYRTALPSLDGQDRGRMFKRADTNPPSTDLCHPAEHSQVRIVRGPPALTTGRSCDGRGQHLPLQGPTKARTRPGISLHPVILAPPALQLHTRAAPDCRRIPSRVRRSSQALARPGTDLRPGASLRHPSRCGPKGPSRRRRRPVGTCPASERRRLPPHRACGAMLRPCST
mgnify:CR=1 FL=1